MEQRLGLSLENGIGNNTYILLLPRDIKNVLYKYLFSSPFKMKIVPDESIGEYRMFERQVDLRIYNRDIALKFSLDINLIKSKGDVNISKFINDIMYNDYGSVRINQFSEFIFNARNYIVHVNVDNDIQTGYYNPLILYYKIYQTTRLAVSSDLLEALDTIAKMENL